LIEQIRTIAGQILADKSVDVVIGYEAGTRGAVRPAFIRSAGETGRLVWNDACTHNLVNYVREKHVPPKKGAPPAKVGVIVKACEMRALNVLLRENQVPRADLYLIGVACQGMRQNSGFAGRELGDFELRCQDCGQRVPSGCDVVVCDAVVADEGDADSAVKAAASPALASALSAELDRLAALSPVERQAFWDAEFERCLRCYACRQACPACYCVECTAEQLEPSWIGVAIRRPEKRMFHTMRAYHLAGRCSGCDECARVCPVGVRLDLLNAWFRREIEATYGYQAGQDATTPAPLASFVPNENLDL
jgi:ferredoxin